MNRDSDYAFYHFRQQLAVLRDRDRTIPLPVLARFFFLRSEQEADR